MNKQNIFLVGFFLIIGIAVLVAITSALPSIIFLSNPSQDSMGQRLTKMGLTSFDRKLAMKFMDKDNDGKCDACGMPVEMCIDSGQLECNMGPNAKIGILGSQHIHADWKIYINGKALDGTFFEPLVMDMSKMNSTITSSFIHLDKGDTGKTSAVLHMHASGVPLWIFFKSVGMDFNKDCLVLPDGQEFCNDGKNTLKFYVNGKPNPEWENYVFKNLDKILISYGNEDVSEQLNSITDFANAR